MNQNKTFDMGGATYETPTIITLEVLSEGVLCMSSHDNTIDNAYEDDWGTL